MIATQFSRNLSSPATQDTAQVTPKPATLEYCMAAGMTAEAAAAATGKSRWACYTWSKPRGLTWARPRRAGPDPSCGPVQTYATLHAEGATAAQASTVLGVTASSCHSWARRQRLNWAKRETVQFAPTDPKGPRNYAEAMEIGMTARQAAAVLGKSRDACESWARKRGLSWAPSGASRNNYTPPHASQVQLWRLCKAGTTLAEAMRITGLTDRQLSTWAISRGVAWVRGTGPQQDFAAALALGLTAAQTARRCAATLASVEDWAARNGVTWPEVSARPDLAEVAYDDSTLDPKACLAVWRRVVLEVARSLLEYRYPVNNIGQKGAHQRLADLRWFWTRDGAMVAMFAGLDIDMLRDHMRAWAVSVGMMSPGQVRP